MVADLTIKDETVYVIYNNGQPYKSFGRKLVYTNVGGAKGVITNDSSDEARYRYEKKTKKDWYDLSNKKREELINKVKEEFEVVEYGPKSR